MYYHTHNSTKGFGIGSTIPHLRDTNPALHVAHAEHVARGSSCKLVTSQEGNRRMSDVRLSTIHLLGTRGEELLPSQRLQAMDSWASYDRVAFPFPRQDRSSYYSSPS